MSGRDSGWDARTASSIHESAHAIIAARLGVPVDVVWIGADGGGETRAPTSDVRKEVQISLAGGAAELKYCETVGFPEDSGRHPRWGRITDEKRAFDAATASLGDPAAGKRLVDECRQAADRIVEREWDAIVSMAADLKEVGNLSGAPLQRALSERTI
jgi:hypothetical protein